jgi:hypothetical protein
MSNTRIYLAERAVQRAEEILLNATAGLDAIGTATLRPSGSIPRAPASPGSGPAGLAGPGRQQPPRETGARRDTMEFHCEECEIEGIEESADYHVTGREENDYGVWVQYNGHVCADCLEVMLQDGALLRTVRL